MPLESGVDENPRSSDRENGVRRQDLNSIQAEGNSISEDGCFGEINGKRRKRENEMRKEDFVLRENTVVPRQTNQFNYTSCSFSKFPFPTSVESVSQNRYPLFRSGSSGSPIRHEFREVHLEIAI